MSKFLLSTIVILLTALSINCTAEDQPATSKPSDIDLEEPFQNRDRGILLNAKQITSTYDSGATYEVMEYGLTYLFNFGKFEIGPIIGIVSNESKNGSDHEYTYALTYGLQGLVNLIDNKTDQNWVPFLGLSIESANVTAISGSTTVNGTGFGNIFSIGVKHFPTGNNVAMFGAYQTGSLALTMGTSNVKIKTGGLIFGIAAYY